MGNTVITHLKKMLHNGLKKQSKGADKGATQGNENQKTQSPITECNPIMKQTLKCLKLQCSKAVLLLWSITVSFSLDSTVMGDILRSFSSYVWGKDLD